MKRTVLYISAGAVLIALGVVYAVCDPEKSVYFPKCVFKALTGFECPGCGSQRAVHDLLSGDFMGAFGHNALMVCAIPFLAVLVVSGIFRERFPKVNAAMESAVTIRIVTAVIVVWWILRNLI